MERFLNFLLGGIYFFVAKHARMKEQVLITGKGCLKQLPGIIRGRGLRRILVVTDKNIRELGLLDTLLSGLEREGISFVIFDGVVPDPTIGNVRAGYRGYRDNRCDGIIAFGGGSVIDCAKVIGVKCANRNMPLWLMTLPYTVRSGVPHLFAVPTTAGTASENTAFAVITGSRKNSKIAIFSEKMIPHGAVLDPELTLGLPPAMTAATGMDALTHAVESYISRFAPRFPGDREAGKRAARVVMESLEGVYRDGKNADGRERLLRASYDAGISFRRISCGYVHALAHRLGEMYHIPHGIANAILLPHVLEYSKDACRDELADLARDSGMGGAEDGPEELADRFIMRIREMNRKMGIPSTVAELNREDFPKIIKRGLREGRFTGAPKLLSRKSCRVLLERLLPG